MVRYLARYLTGGPISDSRILSFNRDEVYFLARPKRTDKSGSDRRRGLANPIPHRLNSRTFMQRWCLHILPKGFTKSRWYGGYHGSKRTQYLERCRQLLRIKPDHQAPNQVESESSIESDSRRCPHCDGLLELIYTEQRPSWREVFERRIYRDNIYSPSLHIF
ncbi:MAG: transposase, partial [Planctomycetales bacterium]|nr:transposase [Planctomycetales bacterium]